MKKKANISASKTKIKPFTVVAIGASVGGLEAVSVLLKNLPAKTGMAYIFVQHLNPDYKSFLTPILANITKMKVHEIENMEHMAPDNLYVIPSNKMIKVTNGHIQLLPRPLNSSVISIDLLFSSLAKTHKENVIGVVLSGNAHDGTKGLKSIKEAGGITIAQDDSAQASSMPKSAIAEGIVDYILSPLQIAKKLIYYGKNGIQKRGIKPKLKDENKGDNPELKTVFELLYAETGVDFGHYKLPTIKRRLNQKMLQYGTKSIKEYAKVLVKKSHELNLLYESLLINVTSFFRDAGAFEYLKISLFPKLLKNKTAGESLRIWVPACSTGEEAYSIAMLLSELQSKKTKKIRIQIFATDLSEQAIHTARIGEYTANSVKAITKLQLKKYFTKVGTNYRIIKEIREMCVFAPHNILRDPPFSRLDFISCCNFLIYFDLMAQKKVFATFHFALNEKGFLMLGKAESTGTSSQLFNRITPKFKVYSLKKNNGIPKMLELAPNYTQLGKGKRKNNFPSKIIQAEINPTAIESAIDVALLARYMPACVVVNKDLEVLQFRGPISLFLNHSSGRASLNILKMAQPEFAFELRNALRQALKTKHNVSKQGIEIEIESVYRLMNIEISQLKVNGDESLLLIVFTLHQEAEKYLEGSTDEKHNSGIKDRKMKKLVEELNTIRAEMNTILETQEATYEELQAANEEIISTNEEFQTLNEELETSKEEIQANNEELLSTNHELHMRNDLLTESYEYSEAIIATIHEPMLVLTKDFHVKSANKSFYSKFLVRKEDTEGKSLFELGNQQWNIQSVKELLLNSISKKDKLNNIEITHTFPDIGKKVMLFSAQLIIQKTHSKQLILIAIKDITTRVEYYKKEKDLLKREKEVAEGAVNSKQQFLSNMSHEIRTPMNAIVGFTKVVLKTELTEKQKEYINAIKVSGDALIVLINDILDLAKVDSGKMTFEQTPFKLAASISAMIHLFEPKMQEKNLILIKEYDENIPEVLEGDPVRLHQIILNLVSNAVKFTAQGQIVVSVIMLSQEDEKVTLQFSVEDTGIGIAENNLATIFDDFKQASSETSRIYGGTGLGLAIVKQLVQPQGGSVSVKSKVGKGSTFSFILSFKKSKIKSISDIIDNHEVDVELKKSKVLVVEDIPLNQLLMKTVLEDFGFEMEIASNGKIAIEMLGHKPYDIILMDLQMPEMNGFEATEYIRKTMNLNIPIIALTADVTNVDVKKCQTVGMNDYISKPIDEKLLYNKIINHLHIEKEFKNAVESNKLNSGISHQNEQKKYSNLNYLKQRTKSNPKLISEVISLFLEQTPKLLTTMKLSLQNKDWKSLHANIHKIIPSFFIVGINKEFEDIAKKIQEYASTETNTNLISELLHQIEIVFAEVCNELELEYETLKSN